MTEQHKLTDAMIDEIQEAAMSATEMYVSNKMVREVINAYLAMHQASIPINEEATVSDPWQKGVKLRWVRQLDQRPLAVIGLDTVTIASRFAPLSVTLKECPGVFPLGWFDLADGVVERFIEELERSAGVQGVHIDSDDCAQMAASLRTALEQSQKRERELVENLAEYLWNEGRAKAGMIPMPLPKERSDFRDKARQILEQPRKSIDTVSNDQGEKG